MNDTYENAPLVVYAFSSIAQSVEHAAVNRAVVGSSPTRGVKNSDVLVSSSELFLKKAKEVVQKNKAPWSSGQDIALSRR